MTATTPQPASRQAPISHPRPPAGPSLWPASSCLLLLSGGGIFLEIALTRLFSTLFFPPYVFAIISLAILGIGLGAALATGRATWRSLRRLPLYLALAGCAVLMLLLTVVWTISIDLHGALLGLVILPYFFTGLALATIFSSAPAASPQLYRADLVGAGLGALLAIPLLNWLGGLNSVLGAAAVFGLAAVAASPASAADSVKKGGGAFRFWSLALTVLTLIALATNLMPSLRWLTVDMAHLSSAKPLSESLAAGGQIVRTRWDSFARTDLVDPGRGKPYQMYIDGAAGSVMPPAGELNLLRTDIGFFPFATARPQQVLIIGPGGGLDVWFALSSQAQTITAVEINPASVEMVQDLAAYNGNLYGQPQVRVLVDEGRSILRREGQMYDLIYLSQVVTLAAERNGYALTENTIYTVEAFSEYLAHLEPGGQIALKLYDELTLTRALVTAVTALRQTRGLSDAEALAHLAAFLDPAASPPIPLLLVQDQPFKREDALAYAGVAAQVGFVPLFVPTVTSAPSLASILTGQATLAGVIAASPSDVSATTDDRPFFYQFEHGLPDSLQQLLGGLGAVVAAGLISLLWFQRRVATPLLRYAPLYFAALGLGFIAVEIALIQQVRLFVGHPTLAVTTVLAVLLIGGGLGSGLAAHLSRWVWPAAGVVLLVLLWLLIWPWLSQTFLMGTTAIRLLIVGSSLLPLALLMGIPFPLGLRTVGQLEQGDHHVALGWAINGVMTVAGSAGAVAVAMLAGFNSLLLVGAGAYLIAAIVGYALQR